MPTIFLFSYSKKRKLDRYANFDPRPDDRRKVDSEEFLRDLQVLPTTTMWERLLFYNYDDYELEANKRTILECQAQGLISHLQACQFTMCTRLETDFNILIFIGRDSNQSPELTLNRAGSAHQRNRATKCLQTLA
jgi:hypothetical protein